MHSRSMRIIAYTAFGYGQALDETLFELSYVGQRKDPMTGCYLLGNGYRPYSSTLMRFISADTMSPFYLGGINCYAYCSNDPINNLDPSGHTKTKSATLRPVRSRSLSPNFRNHVQKKPVTGPTAISTKARLCADDKQPLILTREGPMAPDDWANDIHARLMHDTEPSTTLVWDLETAIRPVDIFSPEAAAHIAATDKYMGAQSTISSVLNNLSNDLNTGAYALANLRTNLRWGGEANVFSLQVGLIKRPFN